VNLSLAGYGEWRLDVLLMPLTSVYIAVGYGGLPSIMSCCSIATSVSRLVLTSGGLWISVKPDIRLFAEDPPPGSTLHHNHMLLCSLVRWSHYKRTSYLPLLLIPIVSLSNYCTHIMDTRY
jgi:hypothetical protein